MSAETPRRFYKDVAVTTEEGGFGVTLDKRVLKTPGGRPFRVPTEVLARDVAAEWDAQVKNIVPATMPMMRFCSVAIDHTQFKREERINIVVKYAETDLLCHRADTPAALAARQAAVWGPLLAWAEETLQLHLPVVVGVIAAEVSPGEAALVRWAADDLNDFKLTGLVHAAGLSGSCVLAFALLKGRLDAKGAFEAAALDDLWSLEKWGEDEEARARLDRTRVEFEEVAHYFAVLG